MRYHPNKSPFKWFATNVRLDLCPTLNITKKEELWSSSKVMFQNTHVQSETTTTTTTTTTANLSFQTKRPSSNPQFPMATELPKATMASRSCFSAWPRDCRDDYPGEITGNPNRSCRATNAATKHRIIKILGKLESCTGFCRFLMLMLKACHCETFLAAQACVKCSTLKKHPQFWCLLELWCLPKRNWCL